jgi:hypothetical protein
MTRIFSSTKREIIVFVIGLLILFAVPSCKPDLPSVFSNLACKPPCWQNIEPGKSSEQEVISILKNIPNIDASSIITHGDRWLIFDDIVYFTLHNKEIKAEVFILNSKVSMILFSGDLNISFGEAIEVFGEPKFIINVPTYSGPPGVPSDSYEIIALQPEQGIEVAYNTKDLPNTSKSKLKPGNNTRLITFFDPNTYDKLLEAGIFSMGFLNGSQTLKYMRPWTGYGEIEEKYPPAIIE